VPITNAFSPDGDYADPSVSPVGGTFEITGSEVKLTYERAGQAHQAIYSITKAGY